MWVITGFDSFELLIQMNDSKNIFIDRNIIKMKGNYNSSVVH